MARAALAIRHDDAEHGFSGGSHRAGCHPLAPLLAPMLQGARDERLIVLAFDAIGRLLSCAELPGTRSLVRLDPATMRMLCGMAGIESVLLVHNHPSGVAMPSSADVIATRRVATTLRHVGLRLDDHLIWTDASLFSFAAAGML